MSGTDDLIESLAADAKPVRRLAPPLLRAALWLGACLLLFALWVAVSHTWQPMLVRLDDSRFALELAATFLTGVAAVIAAFTISLPDRSRAWLLLPLPFLAVWLGSSGYECYRNWITLGPDNSLIVGESLGCFTFMLGLSIPLSVALYLAMRRTRTLYAVQVMAMGGLGIAALSAALLQFFHPFDVTMMDLIFHVAAVLLIVSVLSLFGRTGMRFRT